MRVTSMLVCSLGLVIGCPPSSPDEGEGEGEGAVGEGEGEVGEGEGEAAEGEGEGEGEVALCAPVGSGVSSVVEGGVIDVAVSCAGAVAADFVVDDPTALVPGMTFDADQHLRMATDLDDAVVADVVVRHVVTGERLTLHVAVADDSHAPDNVPPVDPLRYSEELGLPVLFLSGVPVAEEYEAVDVVADGHAYAGVTAKLRGASSLGYPKKSVTLKFDRADRFSLLPRTTQPSASAFRDKKKVVLVSTFDDTTSVRQRLAYQLWNRTGAAAGHTHVTIASTSVVVYVDGRYFGLYTMVDHVDRDLFEESLGLSDGGQLYKSVNHDANFRPKDDLAAGWERRDEPDVDAVVPYSDFNAFMTHVGEAPDATFVAGLADHVDVNDMIDWWIFATAILGEDSYGKNSYLYRPDVGQNAALPVFRFAPWDFNHSFGQAWETSPTAPDVPVDDGWPMDTNLLWERVLDDAVAGPAAYDAYADALAGDLAEDVVVGVYDAMVAEVRAAALKDAVVWSADYNGYFGRSVNVDDDSAGVRAWIAARWAYLRAAVAR